MNMPIMGDNTVLFTSTLFALIRTALGIFSTGDPAYADSELRRTIKKLWPKTSKKILDKMIPLQSGKVVAKKTHSVKCQLCMLIHKSFD